MEFMGFIRPDGRVGVRNSVLVIASVGCAAHAVERICAQTGATAITHQQGCLQLGDDLRLTERILVGAADHPNVGAVLLVGLGCETMQVGRIAAKVSAKPLEQITIQGEGGTRKTVERASRLVVEMQAALDAERRRPAPLSSLIIGTKCGGSDALSGLTANPATGHACDRLVDEGATVLLSETPGLFGSQGNLGRRFVHAEDRDRLEAILARTWAEALRTGEALSDGELSPGNIEGGLTTLTEKSLGATTKAGTRPLQGILECAERPPFPGAWIMDTPGFDVITISGQTAGGAQIIVFTTGRGSPVGSALAPVVKVCSNTRTFQWMDEDMDVNAGQIADGVKSIAEVGEEIFDRILRVANGEETASERMGHREFALAHIGSTL